MFRLTLGLMALFLLSPDRLLGQARERVHEGMAARLTGGGFFLPPATELRDTSIALYPTAHFYYLDVPLEHGGEFRLYGATDSTGQVFLLDAPASFRMLHRRHFHGVVDSVTAKTIALLAARFGGQVPSDYAVRKVTGHLMHASRGDGRQVPFVWDVDIEARGEGETLHVEYWVFAKNGDPQLMSRNCKRRCRATIFDS